MCPIIASVAFAFRVLIIEKRNQLNLPFRNEKTSESRQEAILYQNKCNYYPAFFSPNKF